MSDRDAAGLKEHGRAVGHGRAEHLVTGWRTHLQSSTPQISSPNTSRRTKRLLPGARPSARSKRQQRRRGARREETTLNETDFSAPYGDGSARRGCGASALGPARGQRGRGQAPCRARWLHEGERVPLDARHVDGKDARLCCPHEVSLATVSSARHLTNAPRPHTGHAHGAASDCSTGAAGAATPSSARMASSLSRLCALARKP